MHLCFTARPEVLCLLSKMTDIKVDLLCCVLLPDQETLELHVQKDSRQSQAYHMIVYQLQLQDVHEAHQQAVKQVYISITQRTKHVSFAGSCMCRSKTGSAGRLAHWKTDPLTYCTVRVETRGAV